MFYVRTGRRTAVGMPFWIAPFYYMLAATFQLTGLMVKYSVVASYWILKGAALAYLYAAKGALQLARQGHALFLERKAQRQLQAER